MTVRGFDHVALPLQDAEAMVPFYRALGGKVDDSNPSVVVAHLGTNMINFHRPAIWQRPDFTLRAPGATPPCGDLCFVWDGSPESLGETLRTAGAETIEGPVSRPGARGIDATSVYVRDPDGNLLEFMIYP